MSRAVMSVFGSLHDSPYHCRSGTRVEFRFQVEKDHKWRILHPPLRILRRRSEVCATSATTAVAELA